MAKDATINLTHEQTELFVPLFLQSLKKTQNIQLMRNEVKITSDIEYMHNKVYGVICPLDSDDKAAFICLYTASYDLNTDVRRGAIMSFNLDLEKKHSDNEGPSEGSVSISSDKAVEIDNALVDLCKQNSIEITPATVLKAEKLAKQQKAFNNFINTAFGQTTVDKQIELLKLANQMIKDSVIFVNKSAKDVEEHKQKIRKERRGVFFFTKKR